MTDRTLYLDAAMVRREFGFSRDMTYKIMRRVGHVDLSGQGLRKLYVSREKLERFLGENTIEPF